jgi:hypothetical protein
LLFGCKQPRKNNGIMPEQLNEEKTENNITNDNYLESVDENNETVLWILSPYDMHKLTNIKNETYLYIISHIIDLKFIEEFPKLKQITDLTLEGIYIWNIEFLVFLENLEGLKIESPKIVDISPIANLNNLKWLEICCEEVVDISPIRNLKNLESFALTHNGSKINTLDPIFDLHDLKSLCLYQVSIDLTGIKNLQKLEWLRIKFLNQENLNNLIGLDQLRELEIIDKTDINDVSPLLKLPHLERLEINYDSSINYLPLATSNSLKQIYFYWSSYDDMKYFADNKLSFFKEKDIYVDLGDWR